MPPRPRWINPHRRERGAPEASAGVPELARDGPAANGTPGAKKVLGRGPPNVDCGARTDGVVPIVQVVPSRNGTRSLTVPHAAAVAGAAVATVNPRNNRAMNGHPHRGLAVGASAILACELPHSPKPLKGLESPQEDLMRHGKSRTVPAMVALLVVL